MAVKKMAIKKKSGSKRTGVSKRNPVKGKKNERYSRSKSIDAHNTADILPNPDPIWKMNRVVQEEYRNILHDPHLSAVIDSRKFRTLSKDWMIEKGKAPENVVDFVQDVFENFDVYRSTEEILDTPSLGMQPMEPVWSTTQFDGEEKITIVDFVGRPPYWFQYDKDNQLRFRSLDNPWPGDLIKRYSLIVPRNKPKYDNPYGEANLSKIYWTINFKKGGFKFWVEYLEKYGSPFIEAQPPRDMPDSEFDAFHEKIVELTKGGAVTIPDGATITVHNVTSKASGELYKMLLDFANAEISKCYLGQTLTTEAGDKGARSLGEVHDETKDDFTEADEILAENCFNELIRWLVDLNFGENVVAPEFKYQHEEDIKQDVAERDSLLVKDQRVRFKKDYYVNTYNLNENEFDVVEVPAQSNPGNNNPNDPGPEFAEPDDENGLSQQEAVDKFIKSLTSKTLKKQAEFVEPVLKLISEAKSYEEAQDELLNIYTELRPEEMEKKLGRVMLATEMTGNGDPD